MDAMLLARCLVENTCDKNNKGNPSWMRSEISLLTAIICYKMHRRKPSGLPLG